MLNEVARQSSLNLFSIDTPFKDLSKWNSSSLRSIHCEISSASNIFALVTFAQASFWWVLLWSYLPDVSLHSVMARPSLRICWYLLVRAVLRAVSCWILCSWWAMDSRSACAVCSQLRNLAVRSCGSEMAVLALTRWKASWTYAQLWISLATLPYRRLSATLCASVICLMWMFFSSSVSFSSILCSSYVRARRQDRNSSRSRTSLIPPEKSVSFCYRRCLLRSQAALHSSLVSCNLCSFSSWWISFSSSNLCSFVFLLSSSSRILANFLQQISSFFMRAMMFWRVLVCMPASSNRSLMAATSVSLLAMRTSTSLRCCSMARFLPFRKSMSLRRSRSAVISRPASLAIRSQSFRMAPRHLPTMALSSSLHADFTFSRWVSQKRFSLALSKFLLQVAVALCSVVVLLEHQEVTRWGSRLKRGSEVLATRERVDCAICLDIANLEYDVSCRIIRNPTQIA